MKGSGEASSIDIQFITPDGEPNYATTLSPLGITQMVANLSGSIASWPKPPEIPINNLSGHIPGATSLSRTTKIYFGQPYETPVIQALGVLTMRANILDQALIKVLSLLTSITPDQAWAQYYATSNMKAKLDNIRALSNVSDLGEHAKFQLLGALDKVKSAADRRNEIVHGEWTFRNNKYRVIVHRPNSKTKRNELTVDEKFVLSIIEAYGTAHALLTAAISWITNQRSC